MTLKPISPFEQVVDLIGEDFVPVTLDILTKVNQFYVTAGVNLPTYGQVFDSLKFLQEHGVIELTESSTGQYLVKSIYGKNNQQS